MSHSYLATDVISKKHPVSRLFFKLELISFVLFSLMSFSFDTFALDLQQAEQLAIQSDPSIESFNRKA